MLHIVDIVIQLHLHCYTSVVNACFNEEIPVSRHCITIFDLVFWYSYGFSGFQKFEPLPYDA